MIASDMREFKPGTVFWNAPKQLDIVNRSLTVVGAHFLGYEHLGNTMYLRDCYDELSQEIANEERAMISGTPGIGNSMFGILLGTLASVDQDMPENTEHRRNLLQQLLEANDALMSDEDSEWLIAVTGWYSGERIVVLATCK